MYTRTQARPKSSPFLTTTIRLTGLLVTAIACLGAACGTPEGSDGEIDGKGNPKGYLPGYAVDCLPDNPADPPVCISRADWNCPLRGHYFREAICAGALGGTPSEYDGEPQMIKVDPDGVGPAAPTSEIYCDKLPEGVIAGQVGDTPCNDCNVCSMQLKGYFDWSFKQGYGWDEFAWCPGSYDAISEQICDDEDTVDAPTTGGDDAGTGGSGIWKCIGSWTISGTMNETSPPQSSTDVSMSPPGVPDCVFATDELDAEGMCLSLCQIKNESYSDEAMESPSKNWEPFNCTDLSNFTPIEATDPSECSGGGPMALTDPTPFTANATLTIGGTTTTSDQLGGLMDFTIEVCPATHPSCDVWITEIRTDARTVNGVHADVSGSRVPFSVADLEVRLLQPVLGKWERRSGLITFPGKDLFATISTGDVTLDGAVVSSGLDHVLFEVEGAQGTWDGRQLTLDLPWRKDGLSLSLQIAAR